MKQFVIKREDTGEIIFGKHLPCFDEFEAHKVATLAEIYWTTLPGKELGQAPKLIVAEKVEVA